MPKTIEGIYRDGKIELPETPDGVCKSTRAVVVFLPLEPLLNFFAKCKLT